MPAGTVTDAGVVRFAGVTSTPPAVIEKATDIVPATVPGEKATGGSAVVVLAGTTMVSVVVPLAKFTEPFVDGGLDEEGVKVKVMVTVASTG
jgi:hypothetical protein